MIAYDIGSCNSGKGSRRNVLIRKGYRIAGTDILLHFDSDALLHSEAGNVAAELFLRTATHAHIGGFRKKVPILFRRN